MTATVCPKCDGMGFIPLRHTCRARHPEDCVCYAPCVACDEQETICERCKKPGDIRAGYCPPCRASVRRRLEDSLKRY